jgi:riboflavin kinase/FMN adenylyltransferase
MMQHFTSLDGVNLENTWLTIGSFDGIHIGHQQLIRELNHNAHLAGAKSVVLTFYPHPAVVLRGRSGAFYLTTPDEKYDILETLNTDVLITYPFTIELSQWSAREFIRNIINHLAFHELWVGHDFALGKGREGDVTYLTALGAEFGYSVHVIEPIMAYGRVISSSLIRILISEGKIEEANRLLGRLYRLSGKVIHGDGRGKKIGIPTANLDTGGEKLIPGAGVYACRAKMQDEYWLAAVNVGTRPTFDSEDRTSHVEAYLLDFSGDLYTQNLTIEFVKRLRGEERFESVEDLIKQIRLDIDQTRSIIAISKEDENMP